MTTPEGTATRLRRLLAMLAWLAQVGEAAIDDVAERFGIAPDALVGELEMAACCGLPPYTPDQLMEIVVSEHSVSVRQGELLSRPRRLTPREGFALAASARALLAVPGSDPSGALARALEKLEAALGAGGLSVELDAPVHLEAVTAAIAAGSELEIEYHAASSDRTTTRRIRPLRVFAGEGHWYVDAHCALAGGLRRFRLDRIGRVGTAAGPPITPEPGEVLPTGDGSDGGTTGGVGGGGGRDLFVPGPEARTVRISVGADRSWLLDTLPTTGEPEVAGDRVTFEVIAGGDAWLDRLLVQLGSDARVEGPAEDVHRVAVVAARILERYQSEKT